MPTRNLGDKRHDRRDDRGDRKVKRFRGNDPRDVRDDGRALEGGPSEIAAGVPGSPQNKEYALIKVLEEDEDIHNHYKQLELLGAGTFGETFLVEDVKNPQSPRLAMKVQNKKGFGFLLRDDIESDLSRLYKEMLILIKILPPHKNIIEVKDLLVSRNCVYIVQELCTTLTLDEFYRVVDNTSAQRVFRQIVDAVHLMHEYGVVHCDLKEDNILFQDKEFMECKVIDFGVSIYIPDWATKFHNYFIPSIWFIKEDLKPPPFISKTNDIERLGQILYHMMAGGAPPLLSDDPDIEMRINTRPRLQLFDENAKDLLEKIGPYPFGPTDPANFLTIEQVREHPWLTGGPLTRPFLIYRAEFSRLQDDLTALRIILKDWEIFPFIRFVENLEEVFSQYLITGDAQTIGSVSNLFECEDTIKRGPHVMKFMYRVGDLSIVQSLEESEREPLRIFNELWITLRILPKHANFVEIMDVLVHSEFVVVVREYYGRMTLENFFTVSTDDSSRIVFRQLVHAVRLMHLYGVVHMDLNCHNIIFMDTEFNQNFKIVDFSKALYSPTLAKSSVDHFHPGKWFTPKLAVMALAASVEVDVRALGRILLAMTTGFWQPGELNPLCPPMREVFSEECMDLLSRIGPAPYGPGPGEHTLTMDQICAHPWLAPA
ncbi:hypothetical protein MPTK2_3g14460 [Marchantia polymorpha subsp. ruderalis]